MGEKDAEGKIYVNLELEEEGGEVDMCKSLERKEKKDRVIGAIQGMQIAGIDKDDIINKIVGNFNVTKKYVLNLLNSQMSDNVTRV